MTEESFCVNMQLKDRPLVIVSAGYNLMKSSQKVSLFSLFQVLGPYPYALI